MSLAYFDDSMLSDNAIFRRRCMILTANPKYAPNAWINMAPPKTKYFDGMQVCEPSPFDGFKNTANVGMGIYYLRLPLQGWYIQDTN